MLCKTSLNMTLDIGRKFKHALNYSQGKEIKTTVELRSGAEYNRESCSDSQNKFDLILLFAKINYIN